MARERVQVEGLGRAVPGLQSAVPQLGGYRVQVQETPSWQDTKLGQLAQVLGVTAQGVQEVKSIADVEAQKFEEELARKSPEEIQELLQQNKTEFDKQVRRGGLGWLTSPFNRERKLRAVGRAASRGLMVDITTRLENPLSDDPEDGFKLAQSLTQNYITNNEFLKDSALAQEGLQEAINPQVQQLVINFERKKTALAKRESGLATTSEFFDTIEGLLKTDDYKEGDISSGSGVITLSDGTSISYTDKFKQIWSETNAHTPDEQRQIFKATLQQLAKQGMRNEAEELLIYARGNLKFGNAGMSEIEENEYEEFIENVAEKAENDIEREQQELTDSLIAEAYNAQVDIKSGKPGEFNGQTYNTVAELEKAVNAYGDESFLQTNKARLRKSFMADVNSFRKPSDLRRDRAFFNLNKDFVEPAFDVNTLTESIGNALSGEFNNIANIIELNTQVIENGYYDVLDELREEANALSLDYDDPFELQKALRPITLKLVNKKKQEIREEYRKLASTEKQKKEFLVQEIKSSSNVKVIEPSFWDTYLTPFKTLEPNYQVERLSNLVSVALNDEADFNEVTKAYNLLNEVDIGNLSDVANGRKPISVKLKQISKKAGYDGVEVPLAGSLPFTPPIFRTSPRERFATVKERDQIKTLLRQAMIPMGGYMNIKHLEDESAPSVGKFNPTALDARFIPILTRQEINEGKDSDMVKRKALAIGRGDEVEKFFNEQDALYKKYIKNKRPYPNPR